MNIPQTTLKKNVKLFCLLVVTCMVAKTFAQKNNLLDGLELKVERSGPLVIHPEIKFYTHEFKSIDFEQVPKFMSLYEYEIYCDALNDVKAIVFLDSSTPSSKREASNSIGSVVVGGTNSDMNSGQNSDSGVLWSDPSQPPSGISMKSMTSNTFEGMQEFNPMSSSASVGDKLNMFTLPENLKSKLLNKTAIETPLQIGPFGFELRSAIGKKGPPLKLVDIHGKKYNSKRLLGKITVLYFWHSKDQTCLGEFTKLNELKNAFSGKDIVFLAPNPFEEVPPSFLNQHPFNFKIVSKETAFDLAVDYHVFKGVPTRVIIDAQGHVIHHVFGALGRQEIEHITSMIHKHLK